MFGVALIDCKNAWNLGNALRSTLAFGGAYFIVQGNRWVGSGDWTRADAEHARDKIPMYLGIKDIFKYMPCATETVAVEMVEGAESIIDFKHPTNATYLFGPEDGRIPDNILESCTHKIQIPTSYSLNLAACVACIGHDRLIKESREPRLFCPKCKKSHIKFLENTLDWHCNACGHEWNNVKLQIESEEETLARSIPPGIDPHIGARFTVVS